MTITFAGSKITFESCDGQDTCKHITEISLEDQEQAIGLAEEIHQILSTYILLPPKEAPLFMLRVEELLSNLVKIGFVVKIVCTTQLETMDLSVDVNLMTSPVKTGWTN